ncbi:MAG: BlaI/MecI/CopY family transcriptional regulator [Bacteroidales bacterium]|nr:BlaI/MecI/CopY family transcriptional regulator [Bacteroidales bacterium]
MKELTRAEEQVMQHLWSLKNAFVNDIIEQMPEPKPAYNTVSTIIRILEKKGFVGHTAYGKTHQYHPLISRDSYTKSYLKGFLSRYFSDSYKNMVSFFTQNEKITVNEMEEIIGVLQEQINQQKKGGN